MQDKTSQNTSLLSKVSQSVLCRGTVLPLPHAHQQDTNPPKQMGQPAQGWLLWASEESVSSLSAASPTMAPSPGTCLVPSTSMGPGPRGTRGEPSLAGSTSGIQGIHHPASSSWTPGGRTSQPQVPPHCHVLTPTKTSSPPTPQASMALAGPAVEASSGPGDRSSLGGPGTSSLHPGPGARCPPLLHRGGGGGGSVGAGRATASPYSVGSQWRTRHPAFTTPPSSSGPPQPGHLQPPPRPSYWRPPAGCHTAAEAAMGG